MYVQYPSDAHTDIDVSLLRQPVAMTVAMTVATIVEVIEEATTGVTTVATTGEATEDTPLVTWTAEVTLLVIRTEVDTLPDESTNPETGARLVVRSGTTTDPVEVVAVDTMIDGVGTLMSAGRGEVMTRGPTLDPWLKSLRYIGVFGKLLRINRMD